MGWLRNQSKTPYAASCVLLREPFTFFVDRSLGAHTVPSALIAMGENIVVHDHVFKTDTAEMD
jgi:hypothetical protein